MGSEGPVSKGAGVGIFRLQLFKPSEIFIAMQAGALRRYAPLFIGRRTFGPTPIGSDVAAFGESGLAGSASMLTKSSAPAIRAIAKRNLSLIHAHFGVDAVYALKVSQALNVPLITTLHGFDVTTSDKVFLKSAKPALINYVLGRKNLQKNGAIFICVSEFIREQAIAAGYPPERTVVHYMGNSPADTSIKIRDRSEGTGRIVHVARLVEKKGTIYLLESVSILRKRGVLVHLDIVGDGPLRPQLESRVRELGLDDAVSFLGVLPHREVMEIVSAATVLALPSVTASSGDAEGLGMVLLEAGSCAIPVVGTTSGGIPEAVVDGQTGFLVPEANSSALATALEKILSDDVLAKKMGRNAQRLMDEKFNLARQTSMLEGIYDQVVMRQVPKS